VEQNGTAVTGPSMVSEVFDWLVTKRPWSDFFPLGRCGVTNKVNASISPAPAPPDSSASTFARVMSWTATMHTTGEKTGKSS
jgi:hypothetical protein